MGNMGMNESLKLVLEFYRELGFDRLPLNYNNESPPPQPPLGKGGNEGEDSSLVTPHSSLPLVDKEAALASLRGDIGDCRRCKLSKDRTNIVFGEGRPDAKIMFIGEAPGREEDVKARPFVGDAGQLLTKLIEKMGFRREDVYIANIVKCRPPLNRDPQEDEICTCFPFLDRQLGIIAPQVIVSLGRISAHTLLGIGGPIAKFSITRARGKFGEYKGIPLMPTFHPAYLLRNPKDKWLTWDDAQAVLKKLGQTDKA